MANNTGKPQRGGARPGAGRTTEMLNQRQMTAIETVAQQFPDWSPLLHFATIANDETLNPSIRLEAAKAAAPFYHPRPKPVERDPEALVDLERKLAEARNTAKRKPDNFLDGLAERLERAKLRCKEDDKEWPRATNKWPSGPIDSQPDQWAKLAPHSAYHHLIMRLSPHIMLRFRQVPPQHGHT